MQIRVESRSFSLENDVISLATDFDDVFQGAPQQRDRPGDGPRFKKVLRALLFVRGLRAKDVPAVFSGIVEVDETYLGAQWKNKRASQRTETAKRCPIQDPFAPHPQASPIRLGRLLRYLEKLYRDCGQRLCPPDRGTRRGPIQQRGRKPYQWLGRILGIWISEAQVGCQRGIRKERLPLYLTEYVWRHNHRSLSFPEQTDRLLMLLKKR